MFVVTVTRIQVVIKGRKKEPKNTWYICEIIQSIFMFWQSNALYIVSKQNHCLNHFTHFSFTLYSLVHSDVMKRKLNTEYGLPLSVMERSFLVTLLQSKQLKLAT